MWKSLRALLPLSLLALLLLPTACSTSGPSSAHLNKPRITPAFIPDGRYGRHRTRHMKPRYITIHSTQSYSRGADALAHARMLQRGALTASKNSLGYLTWHYTVDESSIYQSLPDHEQGQHADYEGRGNRQSIGIEMCENAGNSREATLERTARLTAYLMKKHNIPLRRVVGHNHWRRIRYADGRDLGHKNCPHFLLDNGKYGAKWAAFKRRIQKYL
ncbi:MAG: peptidoglycan recognition protein family protein [Verrucomicrobiales bacterium]